MPTLADFERGDKVKILGVEPSRNPSFPLDPVKGRYGTVTEVDRLNLIVWVLIDGFEPLAFEPWEVEKVKTEEP